ncbi:serine/threonine protein kinase [Minicystis rosea]|nr:serine/threonine protein kinase [Minicystis rosea]
MHTFKSGDRFFHYAVGRLLGEGFHGAVHEIIHAHTGDRFALKVMHLENVGNARMVQRALAEARGTYGIDHANVIKVFDLNCEASGLVWMRAELLEGETIAELLARLGRLSPLFAISVALDVAHGLHAAHEAQVIHRDVKPANLFYVRRTRTIKVIDFSIAKIFPEGLQTTMGRAGMGTPAYMSPEQLEGASPMPAFDVYALGMTLWQMLTGRHPFQDALNHSSELFRKQFSEMPPLLSEVAHLPAKLDRVVRRAVAKDPAERYATMKELAQDLAELRAWLEHEADAGRIVLRAPPGEPPIPGDARSRRDYTPPTALPRTDTPASAPNARVVVPEPAPHQRHTGSGLARTVPLGEDGSGLGGTVPLGQDAMQPRAGRGTSLIRTLAASQQSREASSTPSSSNVANSVAPPAPRHVPWRTVALAVVVTSLACIGLVAWLRTPRHHEAAAYAVVPSPNVSVLPSPRSAPEQQETAAPQALSPGNAPPPSPRSEPADTESIALPSSSASASPTSAATQRALTQPRASAARQAPSAPPVATAPPTVTLVPAQPQPQEQPHAPGRMFGLEN